MLRSAALSCAAFSAAALVGCGGTPALQEALPQDDAVVVAEYAGQRLTLDEFETVYARASSGREEAAADSLGAYQDFLSRYVDFRLKVMQAEAAGYAQDSAIQAEMADYREQLARPYFLDRALLDGVVREIYDRQQTEVSASHILVRATPEADSMAAFERIRAFRDSVTTGGADFNAFATKYSQDPSAAQNGGYLGYFSGGRMIAPFEDRAYTVPVDSVSEVFRTRFGYHIMRVEDRRPATPEIRARHILVRTEGEAADTAAARETALGLLARVEAGEDFAELAQQYSDDTGSGARGGDLGFFGTGRMVKPFEDAAFGLVAEGPGATSGLVRSRFGYHIIKLEEIKPRPTFDEAYPELKRLAERLPRTAQKRQELGARLREELGTTFDDALFEAALAQYPADSVMLGVARDRFGPYADSSFATIGDASFTLAEIAEAVARTPAGPDTQAERAHRTAMEYLNEEAVTLAALDLERTDDDFRQLLQDYSDGVLLFAVSEDSVWTRAAQDSVGLRAYFDANAADYQMKERRRVIVYSSRRDSVLTEVDAALAAGADADAVAMRFNDDEVANVVIDTVYVDGPREAGDLYNETLTMAPGTRIGPAPYRNSRVILAVDGVEAARPMTFEEARAQAVADYQDALEAAWLDRLRNTYEVELHPERLAGAFAAEKAADLVMDGAASSVAPEAASE